MRFIKYTYLATALVLGLTDCVLGASVSRALAPDVSTVPMAEYIGHLSGTRALYLRRNLIRPSRTGEARTPPIGVANVIVLPAVTLNPSMSDHDMRDILKGEFALVRECLLRHPTLKNVLIRGEGVFDFMVNSVQPEIKPTVIGILNQVIHETFDNLEDKTVMIEHMSAFPVSDGATPHTATYKRTNTIIGPDPLSRLGATTLIVTVGAVGLSRELSRFIEGGLAPTEGAPFVMIGDSAAAAETVVASAEARAPPSSGALARIIAAESAAAASAPAVGSPSPQVHPGLSEEDQAEINRLFAADFDAIADAAAAAVDPTSPEVRPPIPSQVVRLVDDDLPPFDPSTEADPETRAAMIASLAPFPAAIPASTEDRLLAGVIESDDVDQLWEVSGHDASMFAVILFEKGYEPETVDLLLAAYN